MSDSADDQNPRRARPGVPTIGVIVASTRSVRFADHALEWAMSLLGHRDDFVVDVIDVRDAALPFYDLPAPPARAQRAYTDAAERAIGARLDAADGFVVVTSEFNHGYPAALKNLLDHFFAEFRHKPVAFIGYGNVGGSRAIEQLRQVVAELDMVSARESVHILGSDMAAIRQGSAPTEVLAALEPRLELLVDGLLWWVRATRTARLEEGTATLGTLLH